MTAPDYLLSDAEVCELSGAKRRTRQLSWFADRGVRAELGGDGKVKVLREAVDRHMLPKGRGAEKRAGPNLDALNRRNG